MKIPCSVIQDLLPLYHDNVCSPESSAVIEEHLKDCENCQEAFHKLEDSPWPQVEKEKEEHKSQGLKKVKRTLRRRWVKVAAAAISLTLLVSFALGMFLINYTIIPSPEKTVKEVSVEDGKLLLKLESPFSTSSVSCFIPTASGGWNEETGELLGEPILIFYCSYTPINLIDGWMHGYAKTTSWDLSYPLTEKAWYDLYGEDQKEFLEEVKQSDVWEDSLIDSFSPSHELPWGEIQEVYYYTSLDAPSSEEELTQYGTLLWTAQDGVVYP